MDLNPVAWKFPFDMHERLIVPPQHLVETLARVCHAAAKLADAELPDSELGRFIGARSPEPASETVAAKLNEADDGFVVVGDQALFHPQAGHLRALAEFLAETLDVALMILPGPANSEGAWLAGMVPGDDGWPASRQLADGRKGFVLFDFEPEFDTADPARTRETFADAEAVVAIAAFAGADLLEAADVVLPLAPVPETDGSYVNADGERQWLKAVGKPPPGAHAGWKILRVLGEQLKLDGFDFAQLAEVERMVDGDPAPVRPEPAFDDIESSGDDRLWRVGAVPIYAGDPLVRRAAALQATDHADTGYFAVHPATAEHAGLEEGDEAVLRQDGREVRAPLRVDTRVPPLAVWAPAASCLASRLGAAWGPVELERGS
jgi:NADH-quinone oxidoreductase subunit G